MSKVKWLIIALLSFVLLYSAAWFAITFSICQHLNIEVAGKSHHIFGFGDDDYKIAFDKAVPAGFPFKLGMKLYNLSEESQTSLITHNEPVSVGYDILRQRFYLVYKGGSLARPKPLNSGFGTNVEGEFAHYISYSLSTKVPAIIRDPKRNFAELVNFAEYIEFTSKNVKAHDLINKALLLDESYLSVKLTVLDRPYYHSFEELRNNPPHAWHMTSKAKVDRAVEGRRIAVASLVYGILPSTAFSHEVNVDLLTQAKNFSMEEFVKNSDLKSKVRYSCEDSEDFDGNFSYQSVSDDHNIDVSLSYASSSRVKPNFFEKKIERLQKIAQDLMNVDGAVTVLRPGLNAFLENPKRFLPSNKNNISKIDAALELKLHGVDNKFEFNMKNFSFFVDNAGFKLNNKSELDNLFSWKSSGVVSLNKYKSVVDFFADYSNQVLEKNASTKILDLNKNVYKDFLKVISNHPESDSGDLIFDYEFSSNLEAGKIGVTTIPDVIALYYTTLYRKAIDIANGAPDFNKELEEIAPDLLAKPDLLQKLRGEK